MKREDLVIGEKYHNQLFSGLGSTVTYRGVSPANPEFLLFRFERDTRSHRISEAVIGCFRRGPAHAPDATFHTYDGKTFDGVHRNHVYCSCKE